MFRANIKSARYIRGMFESISSIIDETRLVFDPDVGITMAAMDSSHICLASLVLSKEDCFEFEADERYEIGINLGDLMKVLKRINPGDEISFIYKKDERKLRIVMKTQNTGRERTFSLAVIDVDEEEINVESLEKIEFDNYCEMSIEFLAEAIKDSEIYSEVLQINVDESITFNAAGTIGNMLYEIENNFLIKYDFRKKGSGVYALSFLKNILKISSITDIVAISLKTDSPLKLDFEILRHSKLTYFLAPRVEDDDDYE